jgi:hypothetical protein
MPAVTCTHCMHCTMQLGILHWLPVRLVQLAASPDVSSSCTTSYTATLHDELCDGPILDNHIHACMMRQSQSFPGCMSFLQPGQCSSKGGGIKSPTPPP